MDKGAEEYLKENVKPDDWSKLEECLNDSLWTNNVVKYIEGFADLKLKENIEEVIKRFEKQKEIQKKHNPDSHIQIVDIDTVIEVLKSKIK